MPRQFEYKLVSVKLKGGWRAGRATPEYRDTIAQHAQDGGRPVQAFAPAVAGVAWGYADLIFEREVKRH